MADPEGNRNVDRSRGVMGSAIDEHVYVRDLEEHLRKVLFEETSTTNSEAAVLQLARMVAEEAAADS